MWKTLHALTSSSRFQPDTSAGRHIRHGGLLQAELRDGNRLWRAKQRSNLREEDFELQPTPPFQLSGWKHAAGHDLQYASAPWAYAGDDERAEKLTDDLCQRFPEATIVQFNYLPTLRAKLAVRKC
jgi:hypothetical protein